LNVLGDAGVAGVVGRDEGMVMLIPLADDIHLLHPLLRSSRPTPFREGLSAMQVSADVGPKAEGERR
jgi:hypothetical protein